MSFEDLFDPDDIKDINERFDEVDQAVRQHYEWDLSDLDIFDPRFFDFTDIDW